MIYFPGAAFFPAFPVSDFPSGVVPPYVTETRALIWGTKIVSLLIWPEKESVQWS